MGEGERERGERRCVRGCEGLKGRGRGQIELCVMRDGSALGDRGIFLGCSGLHGGLCDRGQFIRDTKDNGKKSGVKRSCVQVGRP